jgi:hypothetical protein
VLHAYVIHSAVKFRVQLVANRNQWHLRQIPQANLPGLRKCMTNRQTEIVRNADTAAGQESGLPRTSNSA